ncbi:E3 ubiquitin-protein ligase WAV3-like isoform X3 [Rutidosis leptorrhynchoides]|uniref:E3 ubiquitin-protein ligase WAV3-like isoform X3 n=1 Tax=Rutidosis leptorrhynchoides TaxID=125765 RepID=UPI003A98F874
MSSVSFQHILERSVSNIHEVHLLLSELHVHSEAEVCFDAPLVANGDTNIAEGPRRGVKVMEDRRENNPVASVILLSDREDTYTVNGSSNPDHDASSTHSISELSSGTFLFIETKGVIQDALALCIRGLLSVVVKDAKVFLESVTLTFLLGR